MQIFVAHDFSRPPLRNYRRPFQAVGEKYAVAFVFGDSVHAASHLLEQIEAMITKSDACLFDVSRWNHNVFLELGFARGLKKDNYLLFRPGRGVLWRLGLRPGYEDVPAELEFNREASCISDLVTTA